MEHPKFGDRIRGNYASHDNPQRDGFFVELIRRRGVLNPGLFYRCTDGKGEFWECRADPEHVTKLPEPGYVIAPPR